MLYDEQHDDVDDKERKSFFSLYPQHFHFENSTSFFVDINMSLLLSKNFSNERRKKLFIYLFLIYSMMFNMFCVEILVVICSWGIFNMRRLIDLNHERGLAQGLSGYLPHFGC